jgi:TP901 family phage tail tape measure protein
MARARTLTLNTKVNVTGADKLRGLGDKLQSTGKNLTIGVTLPLLAAGAGMVKLASDAEETGSKFDAVFGDLTDSTRDWTKQHADSVNRSRFDLEKYMGTLQDTFVPMGFAREEAAEYSKQITALGIDLASFNNLADDEVIQNLTSAIIGNHQAVAKFGVIINQAALDAELFAMGIEGGARAATEAEKVQARLNIIMASTVDAQGDAARTSDSFANQMRGLQAAFEEVAVELGQQLMPLAKDFIGALRGLVNWFKELNPETKTWILRIAGIAAALGPVMFITGTLIKAFVGLRGAFLGIRTAGLAFAKIGPIIGAGMHAALGPIGLVTGAIALLAAGFATDFLGMRTRLEKDLADAGRALDNFAMDFGDMGATVHDLADRTGMSFQEMKDRISGEMEATGKTFEQVTRIIDRELTGTRALNEEHWLMMDDIYSQGMRGLQDKVATTFEGGAERIGAAAQSGLADPMIAAMLGAKDEMEDIAGQTPGSIADALLAAQFKVEDASEQLQRTAEQALHPMIERAQIIAFLSSQELADGLASGIPAVSQRAFELRAAAEARLGELDGFSYGFNTGTSYAAGLNAAYGYVRTAAGGLAAAARGQIGIQSEPTDPRSPLRGITKWGGNLVDTYAEGIRKRMAILRQVMQTMAASAVPSVAPMTPALAGVPLGAGRGGGGSVNITNITVNVEGRPLDGSIDELVRTIRAAERVNEWGQS